MRLISILDHSRLFSGNPLSLSITDACKQYYGRDTYDEGAEREGMFYGLFIFKNALFCSLSVYNSQIYHL